MTSVSTLGQALRQIENLNAQNRLFADLSTQMATGKKTQLYSGLNTDALTSVRSRTQLSSIDVYMNNITRADTTIGLTLTSIEEFQTQSEEFSATMTGFLQEGAHQTGDDVLYDDPATTDKVEEIVVGNTSAKLDTNFRAVIDHANNLFDFLGELVNAKQGDRYLFAGAESLEKPFTDNGTLEAALNTLITDWKNGTITTDELIADLKDGTALNGNPDAITDTIIGYSPSLSSNNAGGVFVRADENSEFEYTTLANEEPLRNMIVAMAVIKNDNFPPIVDVYEDGVYPGIPDAKGAPGATAEEQKQNFFKLYNELGKMVSNSIDEIDQIRFRMETVRVQMNETNKSHSNQKELLLNTVSDVEDVDVNEVAVKITTLQTQLEASYQVTALTQNLSLVKYL